MVLLDVIAAGHQGRCLQLLGSRFHLDEARTATATAYLIRALLPSFDAWISGPDGLLSFLRMMSVESDGRDLGNTAVFQDHVFRDRGFRILDELRAVEELDPNAIQEALDKSGIDVDTAARMMPYVAVLMMAAIRQRCERELRQLLAAKRGRSYAGSVADPFAAAIEMLGAGLVEERSGAGLLSQLFRRGGAGEARRPSLQRTA